MTLGIGCNKHSGNVKFRQFIKAYKRARFQTNPKIAAGEAVKEVVAFWRNLSPRGRFLAQSKTDGAWHEVEDKQAMRIASFFLMDSGQKTELKRQKSGQAKKEQLMKQPPPATSSSSSAPSSSGNSDLMANLLEPVPIGPVSSIHRSSSAGYQQQQKQVPQRAHSHSLASLPTKAAQQQRESQQLDPWVDDDFDPLPLKFNDDDLDPLPAASFPMKGNNNSYNMGNIAQDIYPNKPQQQQYGYNPEQLQVSFNMVVNAMPHRYSIGDNMNGMGTSTGVNTVANIQIGTINDPTSMMQNNNNNQFSSSNSDYNYSTSSACSSINNNSCGPTDVLSSSSNNGSSNFQFSTDVAATGNGFIQISTQGNPNEYNSNNNAMAMNKSAAGMNMNNNMYGMQQQSNNGNYSSSSQMTMMNSANYQTGSFYGGNGQQQDSFNNVNCNYLSYNDMMNGNNFNSSVGSMGQSQMNAGGMMMMNNNNNLGMNMSSSNITGMNMNNAMMKMNSGNSNMNGNNGNQTWNKNKVANSVPCAADLLGNFDDW